MKPTRTNIFEHSFMMIKKTFRNYTLLSVTILLSFSIMFGYLMFADSNITTKYGVIMEMDSELIVSLNLYKDKDKIKTIIAQLDKMPNTHYNSRISTSNVQTSLGLDTSVLFFPTYTWGMYEGQTINNTYVLKREKINGQWGMNLRSDEAIVAHSVYKNMQTNSDGEKTIKLAFTDKQGNKLFKEFKVVGSYKDFSTISNNYESWIDMPCIYLALSSIDGFDLKFNNYALYIHTPNVDEVCKMLINQELACREWKELQDKAVAAQKNMTENKYVIAMVLFFLLGINLYSSFSNALNERKFEIGVKRAIGASRLKIMLQFLIEAGIVMITNILISIYAVLNVLAVYKYYQYVKNDVTFTITISSESVTLFAVFSISLTVIFSLLFAYQSTNVEIIKYLKEE